MKALSVCQMIIRNGHFQNLARLRWHACNNSPMPSNSTKSFDFAQGTFKPHGHIEIIGEGKLITSHLTGPFNIEGLHAMHETRGYPHTRIP
jgi:hypothetical protein